MFAYWIFSQNGPKQHKVQMQCTRCAWGVLMRRCKLCSSCVPVHAVLVGCARSCGCGPHGRGKGGSLLVAEPEPEHEHEHEPDPEPEPEPGGALSSCLPAVLQGSQIRPVGWSGAHSGRVCALFLCLPAGHCSAECCTALPGRMGGMVEAQGPGHGPGWPE